MAKNKIDLSWANDGIVELDSKPTELYTNTTGIFSQVLAYKIPRGRVAMFSRNEKINLLVPTNETFSHGGTGVETFTATYGLIKGNGLSDEEVIRVFKKSDGTEITHTNLTIDYENDTIDIDHSTAEDLLVFYLAEDGEIRIIAVKPTGAGGNYKRLFNSSIRKLHSINQIYTSSDVQLERSWVMKEKHILKIEVKAEYSVQWLSENTDIGKDIIGEVFIPFRFNRIENFTDKELAHINARYSF